MKIFGWEEHSRKMVIRRKGPSIFSINLYLRKRRTKIVFIKAYYMLKILFTNRAREVPKNRPQSQKTYAANLMVTCSNGTKATRVLQKDFRVRI